MMGATEIVANGKRDEKYSAPNESFHSTSLKPSNKESPAGTHTHTRRNIFQLLKIIIPLEIVAVTA